MLAIAPLREVTAQSLSYAAPLDISTQSLSFDSISYAVGTEETVPEDIVFSPDGMKMFIIGSNGDEINQYSLTTAYEVESGVSHDGSPLDVSGQEGIPTGLTFNLDGTKLYIIGTSTDEVHQYSLTTPFDITSGVSYDNSPYYVGTLDSQPKDLIFNPSGSRLFVLGGANETIYQFDLTTAYDITSGVSFNGGPLSVFDEETEPEDIAFGACGDKLFVLGSNVHQYSMATTYTTTSGVTYDGSPVAVNSLDLNPNGIAFNPLQSRIFLVGGVTAQIYQFSVTNALAFQETNADDGTVEGCLAIEADGVSFVNAGTALDETTHFSMDSLPSGLTTTMAVHPNGTLATLRLSGTADPHKNVEDVADLEFTFTDAAFDGEVAANVTNSEGANSGLGIDFDGESIVINSSSAATVDEEATDALDVDAAIGDGGTNDDGITYSITGGVDASLFSVDGSTGIVTFDAAPDFESPGDDDADNVYSVVVTITDSQETLTDSLSITVGDANDHTPAFTSDSVATLVENTLVVDTVTATDTDVSSELLFSLTGDDDDSWFTVDQTTGILSFDEQPDFENPDDVDSDNVYLFTVTVTDGTFSTSMNYSVTITDNTNEVIPEILSDSIAEFEENETGEIIIIEAIDSDPTNTITYIVVGGNDGNEFDIDGTSGILTFASPPNFESPTDHDADNIYEVLVGASDGENTASMLVEVTVLNAEEAPVGTDQVFTIDENSPAGATVGTLVAKDPDNGALRFEIVEGNDDDTFLLHDSTGILTVIDSTLLDFEANPTFLMTVEAIDADNTSVEFLVTVQLNDVDETVLSVAKNLDFQVYPNPTKSFFRITTRTRIESVDLYSSSGALVKSFGAQERYDLRGLPNGIYFAQIKGEDSSIIQKILLR